MKMQQTFKREIMERFLGEKEMEKFETDYFRAKVVNQGRIKLGKNPFVF